MKDYRKICRILFVTYVSVVMFLCFYDFPPDESIPCYILGIPTDKIVHALMFLPAVPLAFFSLPGKWFKGFWIELPLVVLTAVAAAIMAGLIEIAQGLTPYRSCDLYDFYADCVGIALASTATLAAYFFRRK